VAKKILLVDDEAEVMDLTRAKLEDDGYDVVVSYTGREGVMQARAHLPDIILMDIVLPDMDGADAVKELHDHPATAGIPVLFLSGIITTEKASGLAEITVGGRVYEAIGKPFTYSQLRQRVDHILALTNS